MFRFTRLALVLAVVAVTAQATWAAEITKPVRTLSASFLGVDPYGDDPPFGSDSETNKQFGAWVNDLNLGGGGATADASQNSNIDTGTLTFEAYGFTTSKLYVQGSADSSAKSLFRFNFSLDNPGRVVLDGSVIGVAEFLGSDFSFDRPGVAKIVLRVLDLDTKKNVYRKVIKMDGRISNGTGIEDFSFEDEDAAIELAAGNYRLIIVATSSDVSNNDQVAGSLANAFYEVEGRIEED